MIPCIRTFSTHSFPQCERTGIITNPFNVDSQLSDKKVHLLEEVYNNMSGLLVNTVMEDNSTSNSEYQDFDNIHRKLVEKQLLVLFLQLVQSRQKRFINQRKNHHALITSNYSEEDIRQVVILIN